MAQPPSRRDFLTWTAGGLTAAVAARTDLAADEPEAIAESRISQGAGLLREQARDVPIVESADVVVCGGGPAGVSAAITAARAGAKVRLLEVHGCLGGVWTAGLLSWVLDYRNKTGIMQEIAARLEARRAAVRVPEGAGAALAYRPEAMKLLLEEMCEESGVRVQLFTRVCAAHVDESATLRLAVSESKSGRQAWQGKVFVDASGDGDLMSEVAGEVHDLDARICGVQLAHDLAGAIAAAVIDQHQLPRLAQAVHNLDDAAVELAQPTLLVETGRHDRITRFLSHLVAPSRW